MQPASAALLKLFRELPIFIGLDDRELTALTQLATQKLYPAGSAIFAEGDPGMEAYVVVRGGINIVLAGRPAPIAYITSGNIFGELAFLDGHPRTASAIAVEPAILLALPRNAFDALCTMEPRMGMIVMHNIALALSEKLRRTDRELQGVLEG